MHKKIYSLVITGFIAVNTVCSTGNIYANNIDIEKDIRSERTSSEEDDYVDVPQEDEWAKFTTVESLQGKWNYDNTQEGMIIFKQYLDGVAHPIVEIPRTIEGKKVELEGISGLAFKNVTHIRIAEGNDRDVPTENVRRYPKYAERPVCRYDGRHAESGT